MRGQLDPAEAQDMLEAAVCDDQMEACPEEAELVDETDIRAR